MYDGSISIYPPVWFRMLCLPMMAADPIPHFYSNKPYLLSYSSASEYVQLAFPFHYIQLLLLYVEQANICRTSQAHASFPHKQG